MTARMLTSVLGAPTYGPRGVPEGFSVPGISGISSGVDSRAGQISSALSGFNVSVSDTGLTDFSTGFVSNRALINTLGADVDVMERDDFFPDSLLFSGDGHISRDGVYGSYPLRTLFKVNQFLRSDQGRRMFGNQTTAENVVRFARFVGAYRTGVADWQREATHEKAISLICAGRVRMPDLFRAQKSSTKNRKVGGTVNEGDYVHLLYVRCRLNDELADSFREAHLNAGLPMEEVRHLPIPESDVTPYYWKIEIATTHTRMRIPVYYYSNDSGGSDDYVGFCQYIGQIGTVKGNRKFDMQLCNNARQALVPSVDYKERVVTLPFVEMWLANY